MRSESDIIARARDLVLQAWKKRLSEAQKRIPHHCTYHHEQLLDFDPEISGESNPGYNRVDRVSLPVLKSQNTLGICLYGVSDPSSWTGTICEEDIDAMRCPLFKSRFDISGLWETFQKDMANPNWVEENLPEMQTILWVLKEGRNTPSFLSVPGWVGSLLRFFLPFKPDPSCPSPEFLLPDGTVHTLPEFTPDVPSSSSP